MERNWGEKGRNNFLPGINYRKWENREETPRCSSFRVLQH
jgi:hypothetical protein